MAKKTMGAGMGNGEIQNGFQILTTYHKKQMPLKKPGVKYLKNMISMEFDSKMVNQILVK